MPCKTVIAEFDVAAGAYTAFAHIMREHARVTKETEPGCTRFDVIRVTTSEGQTDESKLVLVESYTSEDAYLEHTRQPRLVKLRESYAGMLSDRRVVRGFID